MVNDSRTPLPAEQLSAALEKIVGAGMPHVNDKGTQPLPGIPISELVTMSADESAPTVVALRMALALLTSIGLIVRRETDVFGASNRYALFALASFAKLLRGCVTVTGQLSHKDMEHYLTSITKALEKARIMSACADQSPIHSRRMVSVIIRGTQARDFIDRDVFLFVLHPEWKQYHLVGLSDKGEPTATEAWTIRTAMTRQLNLEPEQYVVMDAFRPEEQSLAPQISETSGALTKYSFRLRAIKEIKVDLNQHLAAVAADKTNPPEMFRWFTMMEITNQRGRNGEPIMSSTIALLRNMDIDTIPRLRRPVKDQFGRPSITDAAGNRISIRRHWPLIVMVFASLITVLGLNILASASPQDFLLTRVASVSSIVQGLLALIAASIASVKAIKAAS